MSSLIVQDITEFHEKFGLEYKGPPRKLPGKLQEFRNNFLFEEFCEYIQAGLDNDPEAQLDALVDLVYVAIGTAYLNGYDFQTAWNRVHAANMSKVRGESKRSEFDIVKPDGWKEPDLSDLVEAPK